MASMELTVTRVKHETAQVVFDYDEVEFAEWKGHFDRPTPSELIEYLEAGLEAYRLDILVPLDTTWKLESSRIHLGDPDD